MSMPGGLVRSMDSLTPAVRAGSLTIVLRGASQHHARASAAGDPGAGEVPGLKGLGPSFLSVDTDGRVIRLDTFSKLLAPGLRLGWISSHPAFIQKINSAQNYSSVYG
ncbi:hypothetical protein OAO87_02710 [bacterium]|nr:hypothetical protein [bacterium]